MRGSIKPYALRRKAAIAAAAMLTMVNFVMPAEAMPTGSQITSGVGDVATGINELVINQHSPNLDMNWQSFSIAGHEQVRFVQPSVSAIALNRVTSGNPSEIFGKLSANGKVFLINPQGILFGPTSQINVGGLVASTLQVATADFAAGNFSLNNNGAAGAIINNGSIRAVDGGFIALIGPQVVNEGEIVVNQGTVALAAGNDVALKTGDNLQVTVNSGSNQVEITNRNLIRADGGRVMMIARPVSEIASSIINLEGMVQAKSISTRNGEIVLDGGDGDVTLGGSFAIDSADINVKANNIHVEKEIRSDNPAGNGGNIKLTANNSVLINADIVTDNGNLQVTGNAKYKATGNITMKAGTTLNAGRGIVDLTTSQGLSGNITLANVVASTFNIGGSSIQYMDVQQQAGSGIRADLLTLVNSNATFHLTGDNYIRALAAKARKLYFSTNGVLDIITARMIPGISATGRVEVAATGDMTIRNGSKVISQTTDRVVLSTKGNFINRSTADAVQAPKGRFLIYSTHPAQDVKGGLVATKKLYNRTLGNYSPDSEQANSFLYSVAPVLTVTANDQSGVYGDENGWNFTSNITGFIDNDDKNPAKAYQGGPAFSMDGIDAGTYPIIAQQGSLSSELGYKFEFVPGTMEIKKAPLTVTALNANRLYGDANPSFNTSFSEFKRGDTKDVLTGSLIFNTAAPNADVGVYDILPSGLTAKNYDITYTAGKLTVDKAPLTIKANDARREYGEANPKFAASFEGFKIGQSVANLDGKLELGTSATQSSDAGIYDITAGGVSSKNYNISFENGKLTVNKAPLAVKANDARREYGEVNPVLSATFAGFKLGQSLANLDGKLELGTSATQYSDAGGYAITPAGVSSNNYDISFADGKLTIDKAPLKVKANDARREYGDVNPEFNASYAGFKLGQGIANLDGKLELGTSATQSSDAGIYDITATGVSSKNYNINFEKGNLIVDKAQLTIKANDTRREYGEVNPEFSATYAGFKLGQSAENLGGKLQFVTSAAQSSDVGEYDIATGGVSSKNYDISFAYRKLTIDKAHLTVKANDARREYGEVNPEFSATYAGFKLGQSATNLNGQLQVGTSATQASDVGDYIVTPTGVISKNYDISFVNGKLIVDKAPLTIKANDAWREYGEVNPNFNASYAGFKLGQGLANLQGKLELGTPATQSSDAGIYDITAIGVSSNNYDINFENGKLTVDKASLIIQANDARREYGEANPEFGASYTGFKLGQSAASLEGQLQFATSANQSSDVGIYGITPGGISSNNYNISFASGKLTIKKAPLTIKANDAYREHGSPVTDFSASFSGFKLGQNMSNLNGDLQFITPTKSSAVGVYNIMPAGLSSPNYDIGFVAGELYVLPKNIKIADNAFLETIAGFHQSPLFLNLGLNPYGNSLFRPSLHQVSLIKVSGILLNPSVTLVETTDKSRGEEEAID